MSDCSLPRRADFTANDPGSGETRRGWGWSGIYRLLLFRGIIDWRSLRGPAAQAPVSEPDERDRFTDMELDRVQVFRAGSYSDRWQCLRDCVLRMARLRPDLTLLIVPDLMQVDDALWAQLMEKAGDVRQFDRMLPNRRIAELGGEAGLRVIDATGALRQAEEATYIPWDSHPNRFGNRIIAEVVAKGLLP